jgi:predicted alpha/beta-hydrolase family hydrolase
MRVITTILILFGLSLGSAANAAGTLGVVILHGKQGTPEFMEPIASAFRSAGFLTETPEMPWSRQRIYDAPFSQSLSEIDSAVARLREKGATKVVVAGMSMGGPAVIAFGATRQGVDGLLAWAPAHDPVNDPAMRSSRFLDAVASARSLIDTGKGDEVQTFPEINKDIFSVRATPKVWLSYWDPDGSNSMPRNAAAFSRSIPLMIVVTPRDPFPVDENYILRKTPAHPLSRLLKIDVPHLRVPFESREQSIAWLKAVQEAD